MTDDGNNNEDATASVKFETTENNRVKFYFSVTLQGLCISPQQARLFAANLIEHAEECEANIREQEKNKPPNLTIIK